jgi:hypothetical protein
MRHALDQVEIQSTAWNKENDKITASLGKGTVAYRMEKKGNLTLADAYGALQHWQGMANMYAAAIIAENSAAECLSELRRAQMKSAA